MRRFWHDPASGVFWQTDGDIPDAMRASYPEGTVEVTEADFPPSPAFAVNDVPQSVSAFQAIEAMAQAGLLETVEAAVLASGDAKTIRAWKRAGTWNRTSPTMLLLAQHPAIGLTEEALDQLFIDAAQITA